MNLKKILAGALAGVMAVASATVVSAAAVDVVDADKVNDELTVTGFYVEKTGAVELKKGGSYTISFHNKSNGTAVYENFVLGVATAEAVAGDALWSADAIMSFRADNWLLVGNAISGVGPDGFIFNPAEGTVASYVDGEWGSWADVGYGGLDADIKITISRDAVNDQLTYRVESGAYYESAIYNIALPESVYVYLTGENCKLTNIKVEGGNPEPAYKEVNDVFDVDLSAPIDGLTNLGFVDMVDGSKVVVNGVVINGHEFTSAYLGLGKDIAPSDGLVNIWWESVGEGMNLADGVQIEDDEGDAYLELLYNDSIKLYVNDEAVQIESLSYDITYTGEGKFEIQTTAWANLSIELKAEYEGSTGGNTVTSIDAVVKAYVQAGADDDYDWTDCGDTNVTITADGVETEITWDKIRNEKEWDINSSGIQISASTDYIGQEVAIEVTDIKIGDESVDDIKVEKAAFVANWNNTSAEIMLTDLDLADAAGETLSFKIKLTLLVEEKKEPEDTTGDSTNNGSNTSTSTSTSTPSTDDNKTDDGKPDDVTPPPAPGDGNNGGAASGNDNPSTGAVIVLIPAAIAAAGVLISKKRK